MTYSIETRFLTRTYYSYIKPEGFASSLKGFFYRQYQNKVALKPTSISIEAGQIVGLVGANGAGKTTLLKLLAGLIHPTSGDAKILGFQPWGRSRHFLKRISILLGQKNQLWWDIPAADSFSLLADIYEIDKKKAWGRVVDLARVLHCEDQLQVQLRRLSLGERMKMEVIGSLLHQPEVIFLDEPTIGLDIVAQEAIRDFLKSYVTSYRPTIILTSHYMDDISKLAHRLLLLSRGELVYDGDLSSFTSKAQNLQKISARIENPSKENIIISAHVTLEAGATHLVAEVPEREVSYVIQKLLQISPVHNLRIEEADFEDDIRKFFEKESR